MKFYCNAFLLVLILLQSQLIYPQWVSTSSPGIAQFSVFNSSYLFANGGPNGIYRYNGKSWVQMNNGLNGASINCITISGNNIFAGGYGLFRSTNFGSDWSSVNNGLSDSADVYCLVSVGTNIFAGTFFGGVFLSTNNGDLWTPVNNGLPSSNLIQFAVNGTTIFAIFGNGTVYSSTNNGTDWIKKSTGLDESFAVTTIASYASNMLLGSGQGVSISTNFGDSWTQINNGLIDPGYIRCFAVYLKYIFAGIQGDGFFYSTNSGKDWIQDNYGMSGLNSMDMNSIAIMGNNIIIGGYYQIWTRPLSQITAVSNDIKDTPNEYSLLQNYPNPFNPSSTINYSIKDAGLVKLEVFDILGRRVETLVNEEKQSGAYSVTFNAKSISSGVYFYKMEINKYVLAKKMIFMK